MELTVKMEFPDKKAILELKERKDYGEMLAIGEKEENKGITSLVLKVLKVKRVQEEMTTFLKL